MSRFFFLFDVTNSGLVIRSVMIWVESCFGGFERRERDVAILVEMVINRHNGK